jgi:hypothetical protein
MVHQFYLYNYAFSMQVTDELLILKLIDNRWFGNHDTVLGNKAKIHESCR